MTVALVEICPEVEQLNGPDVYVKCLIKQLLRSMGETTDKPVYHSLMLANKQSRPFQLSPTTEEINVINSIVRDLRTEIFEELIGKYEGVIRAVMTTEEWPTDSVRPTWIGDLSLLTQTPSLKEVCNHIIATYLESFEMFKS